MASPLVVAIRQFEGLPQSSGNQVAGNLLMVSKSQLDIKHLRYFVATIDAGSISRAALALNIVQPALTSRILRIEDELGVKLLIRSVRGVTPTEEGRVLYATAKRLLDDLSNVTDIVKDLGRNPTGHVSIGLSESVAAVSAVPLLIAAFSQLPKVRISLASGQSIDIYRRLTSGELDLAVISTSAQAHGMSGRQIVREEMFLAVSAKNDPLPGCDEIAFAELEQFPIVLPLTLIFSVQEMLRRASDLPGLRLKVIAEVDSLNAIASLIASGHACSVVGYSAMKHYVHSGDIKLKRIGDGTVKRSFDLCRPVDRSSNSATDAVERLLISTIGELISGGDWLHAELA
ncbi:LysR family transcriptional regulator [Sphingomonas sp. Root720]|uniref:LysR family transcriptional regulator n=2 Tax=Sphingomonas TaxID=13687 RepID=UPI0009E7B671|nr:LysR substrate-binding domain-containing protein [Sphingomonas sp. Root720]